MTNKNKDPDAFHRVFEDFRAKLQDLGILMVTAAGNSGLEGGTTADTLPQSLGTDDNNIFTVGGLNIDGTLWPETSPEGTSGSISAYNLATDLTLVYSDGTGTKSSGKYGAATSNSAALSVRGNVARYGRFF